MSMINMRDLELSGRRVLIRQDLNVPIKDGKVSCATRIEASLETIRLALDAGAAVMLMSHRGRPQEGVYDSGLSLRPVADYLTHCLGREVPCVDDYLVSPPPVRRGEVILLENVRFNSGEKDNDDDLSRKYAGLCDIFVMDAFGTAHRAQASTYGVAKFAPVACCGPLLRAEVDALSNALEQPNRPLVAIVGGAKVSTKLTVLESLSGIVDQLIPGGGIANTFIAAAGYNVGKSLVEVDLIPAAQDMLERSVDGPGEIPIPRDVVVAKSFSEEAEATVKLLGDLDDSDLILDIGPQTAQHYSTIMSSADTIVWNGPLGVFEFEQFSNGTRELGRSIANASAFSIAGGGDTLAAVEKFELDRGISYISTGGGAFLEFLEGKVLPAIDILEARNR